MRHFFTPPGQGFPIPERRAFDLDFPLQGASNLGTRCSEYTLLFRWCSIAAKIVSTSG